MLIPHIVTPLLTYIVDILDIIIAIIGVSLFLQQQSHITNQRLFNLLIVLMSLALSLWVVWLAFNVFNVEITTRSIILIFICTALPTCLLSTLIMLRLRR